MINIVGQEKLLARIATYYSTQQLPKTLMFLLAAESTLWQNT